MLMTQKQMWRTKAHDTIAIFGSGYSINTIKPREWEYIKNECDSIAMSWFCMGHTPVDPKYYMVNAQGIKKNQVKTIYDYNHFLRMIKCEYPIILSNHYNKKFGVTFHYDDNIDVFNRHVFVIYRTHKGNFSLRESIVNSAYVDVSILSTCCHFAYWMGYSKVILFGVDLYDSAYYFDGGQIWGFNQYDYPDIKRTDRHVHWREICDSMKKIVECDKSKRWFIHNPRSLLAGTLPVWRLEDVHK